MHRPVTFIGIAVAALVLGAAPAAQAANPDVNRRIGIGGFSDPDFCGTGQTVNVSFNVQVVEFCHPDGGAALVQQGNFWLTNPQSGATVQNHFAGRFTQVLISGDPAGIHTIEYAGYWLGEQLRLLHGRVLSLDAGYLGWLDTFDGDQWLFGGITINRDRTRTPSATTSSSAR